MPVSLGACFVAAFVVCRSHSPLKAHAASEVQTDVMYRTWIICLGVCDVVTCEHGGRC